jgi:hypothetical protein
VSDSPQYLIIGGDGRQYGPASADELRQWIRDGRAVATTPVQPVGSDRWRPLSEFPELGPLPSWAFDTPAPGRAPGAIRVFGILFTGFGGLGVLCWPVGFLSLGQMERVFGPDKAVMGWLMFGQVLSLIGALVMLTAGIGLLRQRPWARGLAVGYAWAAVVLGTLNAAVLTHLLAGRAAGDAQIQSALLGAALGAAVGLIFNGLTIYFLTRPSVKEHLARHRPRL